MHAIFYDALPAFFIEDDVYDCLRGCFLDTAGRGSLLNTLPPEFSHSAPVLYQGRIESLTALKAWLGASRYKSAQWEQTFSESIPSLQIDGIDSSRDAEGLYIKVEHDGRVGGTYKWIRPCFLETVMGSSEHWTRRKMLFNLLARGETDRAPQ